jgi:L-histidine N-alpha-methyltransferase
MKSRQAMRAGTTTIDVLLQEREPADVLAEIRRDLLRTPREIAPKNFYDDRGSHLFEAICELPEYYQTRTESALLRLHAERIVQRTGACELVELGAGSAIKTRWLLDAMARAGRLAEYVPFDFSEGMVRRVARELADEYPGVHVHGIVGDFVQQLDQLPPARHRDRLVIFLGGTIGNFRPEEARDLLARLATRMRPGEFFLLGTDLVKDPARLEAAYDDAAGVTAQFDLNVLYVLNRLLGGDFEPSTFRHRAFYDRERRWIEMRLVSTRAQIVHLPAIDLVLHLAAGEEIRTEISAKYDRPSATRLLGDAGFAMVEWYTDPENLFALSLARRA